MQLLLHCLQLPDHEAMPEERVVQDAPSSMWEYLKKAPRDPKVPTGARKGLRGPYKGL